MPTTNPFILIVDEDHARIQTIRLALPELGSNIRIGHASDVKSLTTAFSDHAPDLILCAPDCPKLNLPLVRQLISEQDHPIPLIAFTDLLERKNIVDLVMFGADDVADFKQSEHLALVTASHLEVVDELRNRWALREDMDDTRAYPDNTGNASDDAQAEWRKKLLEAVKKKQFSLSEQRISSLQNGSDSRSQDCVHIDILLRLNLDEEDDDERLPAAKFLEEARKAGLSPLIDVWVIEQVCSQLKKMVAQGQNPRLFVRLEPSTVDGSKFASFVEKCIRHHGCKAENLVLELPQESFEKLSKTAVEQLRKLRAAGCNLSMSHCSLKKPFTKWPDGLAPQYTKISPRELGSLNNQDESIQKIKTVVETMHSNGVRVIAPHVEHADSLAMIWSAGVDYAQGYYHSHPTVVMTSDAA